MLMGGQIRSKILHKGLALVIVPCIVDGVFCWQLNQVLNQTEQIAKEEETRARVIALANQIITVYGSAAGKMTSYALGRDQRMLEGAKAQRLELRRFYKQLQEATNDGAPEDKDLSVKIDHLRQVGEQHLEMMEKMGSSGSRDGQGTSIVALVQRLRSLDLRDFVKSAGEATAELSDFTTQEQRQVDRLRSSEEVSKRSVKNMVFYGIVGNSVLALVLALLFLTSITNRLAILVENARRLGKQLPLDKRVKGTDELTYLDNVLHEADKELRNSAEQRQYLMQMVAHDLRSPLMSAQVALDLLLDPRAAELPPMATRQIQALKRNMTRLTSLTNDLLTIDKLEAGKLDLDCTTVEVRSFVDEAAQTLLDLARQKIIDLRDECTEVSIFVDRGRMLQVLTNLLSNAIKFSPQGAPIVVSCTDDTKFVTIRVKDKGPGIAASEQKKIFSKFFQLDGGTGKGFGLGLAICKLITEAHGGTIGVESDGVNGSCFWFRVPIAQSSAADSSLPSIDDPDRTAISK
jgi:signal transduction histidine kinase